MDTGWPRAIAAQSMHHQKASAMWFVAWHYAPSNGRQFRGRGVRLMLARALSQSTLFHSADYGFASSALRPSPFVEHLSRRAGDGFRR